YINNQKAPIVGNVCMDMIMVNVTNINCQEGDEVLIFKDQLHIEDLAKRTNTIPYELLTAISQRIKRVIK
ncbi:MAG: alanine racemase C-terminal domain-containing protein, partial [Lutibacter sp.]|nr:alanine racemase C-terminal domain-containing protein [Lutibacter sp.]